MVSDTTDANIDPSNEWLIGTAKHIYPLIARTIQTDEYNNTESNKDLYLEFIGF